ncbi:MAG: hypothetical protein ACKVRN_02320 [Pyrinomonadaceae bacterium]
MKPCFALILLFSSFSLTWGQVNPFPNELSGFEFFAKGRIKSLVLGISKKQDVERLFGNACESECDYDDRFLIKFDYLDLRDCMTTRQIRDRAVCPLDQYIGTIGSIKLTPKKTVPVDRLSTDIFKSGTGGTIVPKGGGETIYYESFTDEYGLRYSFRRNDGKQHFPPPKFVDGELYSIDYILSEKLEIDIFKAPFRKTN